MHTIHPGMLKDDVAEMLGQPSRVEHHRDQEIWVYKLQQGERSVVFVDNEVLGTSDPAKEHQLDDELNRLRPSP